MSRRTLGFAVTAIGVIVVVTASLADQIGIGCGDRFGWKQTVGVILGAVVVVAGLILATQRVQRAPGFDTHE